MMDLTELSKIVLPVMVLQVGFGVTLFAVTGGAPGVNLPSIGLSVVLVTAVSSAIATVLYRLIGRYTRERAVKTAMMAMTEDEETVLRKIMNPGEVRQDELRRQVDFSKSKLSALVNNLVEKNAVKKTRRGRTNMLEPREKFKRP
ncbi:hypothetical protein AKJ65_04395 [candidate division MSBL1 archaeon SCGC-AAA259E19]|uniref:DUF7343 domain-containing protein n=1 Tax=candidate division MSBL1 archaeon SCGC-AAA259E19 TaxID=1698264 RepID=A0A133UJN8_9EURY|nr:hypothetical protein AKJ65_04395 [candidate division MSBL1 archaeon SCGC-AAA259E19]